MLGEMMSKEIVKFIFENVYLREFKKRCRIKLLVRLI